MAPSGHCKCLAGASRQPDWHKPWQEGAGKVNLRKVLIFNTVLGLTLPKHYTSALGLKRGDYAEVYLRDNKTIVIKKHGTLPKQITLAD